MAKKKKKAKDKIREKINKKKREKKENERKYVKFKCLTCGIEEDIPRDIVEMLDFEDGGDLSVAPRFDCEECIGTMEPIYYKSVHGIIYDMKQ